MAVSEDLFWSFGIGSNMDVEAVRSKKGIDVKQFKRCTLQDYNMVFNFGAMAYVEPRMAACKKVPGEICHGVALQISKADMDKLDKAESAYDKDWVDLTTYEGESIHGYVYVRGKDAKPPKEVPHQDPLPSKRYLGVLLKGAKQAGLAESYLDRLRNQPTYTTQKPILDKRNEVINRTDLPLISYQDERWEQHKTEKPYWVSTCGYIFEADGVWFGSHRGRDITHRMMCHFNGIAADENDDGGVPPYPLLEKVDPSWTEFVYQWMDFYIYQSKGNCIGKVKEFFEQQESGESEWVLPSKPSHDDN